MELTMLVMPNTAMMVSAPWVIKSLATVSACFTTMPSACGDSQTLLAYILVSSVVRWSPSLVSQKMRSSV